MEWTFKDHVLALTKSTVETRVNRCLLWCGGAVQRLDDGTGVTGWREMTKYHRGKGIMPGKGTKLPAGLFKGRDVFFPGKDKELF